MAKKITDTERLDFLAAGRRADVVFRYFNADGGLVTVRCDGTQIRDCIDTAIEAKSRKPSGRK